MSANIFNKSGRINAGGQALDAAATAQQSGAILPLDPVSLSRLAEGRLVSRRVVVAVAVALALHSVAFYFLIARTVPIELTSAQSTASTSISVSLVSVPVAKPVIPEPKSVPQMPRLVKRPKVLTTHRASPRTVEDIKEADPSPVAVKSPAPIAPQSHSEPAPTEASPAAAPNPAGAGPKIMALPKAIDMAGLRQLGCRIPQPNYPPRARRLHEEGVVRVQIKINTNGRFSDVRLLAGSGFPELDEAALEAVSQGSCEPYLQGGQPTVVTAVQPVSFNLDD